MFTTVIIPTLNEERTIGPLLTQLLNDGPDWVLEILVADGGSTDQTREIVADYSKQEPKIKLIENPDRIQASGINLAASIADSRSQVIIRIDAHAIYPSNYVKSLLVEMARHQCASVVVRLRTVGCTCFQVAVANVCNSNVGTGGSVHRVGGVPRFVDHGHHAAFNRKAFADIGGYDPSFSANEDAEFDLRLRASGGLIWFASDLVVDYIPRSTVTALAWQYFRYGYGRSKNFRKHGGLRLRQLVPPIFLISLFGCVVLAMIFPVFLLFPIVYLCVVTMASLKLWWQSAQLCCLGALVVIPVIHLSWALGFWRGLLR